MYPLNLVPAAANVWSPTNALFLGRRMMAKVENGTTNADTINDHTLLNRSRASLEGHQDSIGHTVQRHTRPTTQLLPRSPAISNSALGHGQMPISMAQAPRSAPRQSAYGYYADEANQQYPGTPIQAAPLPYQSDYATQDPMQRPGTYPSYPSNMVYNMPQTNSSDPYDQQYPPRQQAAAIEVLSNQFGVSPYYPGEGSPHAANFSPQQPQAQYPNMGHAGRSSSQPYNSPLQTLNAGEDNQQFMYANPEDSANPDQAMDNAYNQYQEALRSCYQNVRDGRLASAGEALVNISEWLLSNAVDLGLVRDEQELHKDRSKLWNEFNLCWISAMRKQKELLLEQRNTGQAIQPPRDLITEDDLDKMGRELVRLCDNMEKHGLVDYQMGVWEEEILDALQECLDLLETQPTSTSDSKKR